MKARSPWRWAARALAALLVLMALAAAGVGWAVHASLPQLDGDIAVPGLAAPLTIARDPLGTAVLQGANRLDLARGLGFVHAQERYFEMDLTRRSAAGELSALFGPLALERDKARRLHRMRARLTERWAQLAAPERALLQAYTAGVNAGLAQLAMRPWPYLLLRAEPQAWSEVDSLLVIAEMFWMLQGNSVDAGLERALLRERVGDALYGWLDPRGGRWDAALDGSEMPPVPLPGPELLDLRRAAAGPAAAAPPTQPEAALVGSNQWAVAGSRTAHGGAMLADDMHLALSVPNTWYRAQLEIVEGARASRAVGLTLPGLPAIVVGSNGAVAWGFTNAYGQWFDWIKVPKDLPAGRLRHTAERIEVKGGEAVLLDVQELDGAPVARQRDGQAYAVRWIAHQPEAINLALDGLLQARSVDEALPIAQASGMPHQNIVLADRAGHIAWTIAGKLWAAPEMAQRHARFQPLDAPAKAWLPPADYPLVKDPANGQLWTANSRQFGGADGALIGDGGFDLGARARQIRDRLSETPRFDEATLGAIHFDDEARFMQTWGQRIAAAVAASPKHTAVAGLLQKWNGRADADQAGYRLVRSVRLKTMDTLWAAWTTPLLGEMQADPQRRIPWRNMFEYPATQALDRQPAHLLPPAFASWNALLLAQVDATVSEMTDAGRQELSAAIWGAANTSRIQHPLSRAIPALSRWLDMPQRPQSGDANLPHVAQPAFGQSQRLVVSPGREAEGTLSMPGGQSGHPMSPYFGAGHEAWAQGRTQPLLAGATQHSLRAMPAAR